MGTKGGIEFDRWPTEVLPVKQLTPAGYNPRKMTPARMRRLEASLHRFGIVQPIVWNKRTRRIVGGHQRVKILAAAGVEKVECKIVDLPEAEEKALNVALNNPEAQGEFTEELDALLKELQPGLGDAFDLLGLDKLVKDTLAGLDEIEAPQIEQAVQLKPPREYVLVMCGDDTEGLAEFEKLKVLLNLKPVRRGGYKKGSPFDDIGTQRVVHARELIGRLQNVGRTQQMEEDCIKRLIKKYPGRVRWAPNKDSRFCIQLEF